MADIARHAGVSLQTVSRVVRKQSNVSDSTREKIMAAITALDYEPDAAAQLLASGRSRSIGVINVGEIHFGMQQLFISIEAGARKTGKYVVSASAPENDTPELIAALKYLRARGVLATVVVTQNPTIIPVIERADFSQGVLVISGRHHLSNFVTIGFDQVKGARDMTRHLLDSKHSILHVAGPLATQDAMERLAAYQEACKKAGVPARWVSANGWSAEHGYQVGKEVDPIPDAVFAASDQLALGYMRALHERGHKAGSDYIIGGFDDIDSAQYLWPSLTTVQQNYSALADAVINTLNSIIENRPVHSIEIPTSLIVRESAP